MLDPALGMDLRFKSGVMRCLSCGGEMAATASVPDGALAGFEHRTFTCAPCGVTECRLLLSRDLPPLPQPQPEPSSAATTPPAEETTPPAEETTPPAEEATPAEAGCAGPPLPALPEEEEVHEEPAPAPMLVPAAAWTRAVEKLRHHEADLSQRAQEAKKASWNYRFDQVWQRLVPDSPQFSRANGANQKAYRHTWSPQTAARSVIPRRRPVVELPVVKSSPEQIQKFNEFWDGLLSRELPVPASRGSSLAPLPRSVSLVPVESAQGASAATRVILLLRRMHSGRMAA
jgi:hypothetical protein